MDHVAILNKQLPWLERIQSGEKRIESRWYEHKKAPWNNIAIGDRVFFKNSGQPVTLVAHVSAVCFYGDLTPSMVHDLIKDCADDLGLRNTEVKAFTHLVEYKRFCILVTLIDVTAVVPFAISKKGFGSMSAWISVADIDQIKL